MGYMDVNKARLVVICWGFRTKARQAKQMSAAKGWRGAVSSALDEVSGCLEPSP